MKKEWLKFTTFSWVGFTRIKHSEVYTHLPRTLYFVFFAVFVVVSVHAKLNRLWLQADSRYAVHTQTTLRSPQSFLAPQSCWTARGVGLINNAACLVFPTPLWYADNQMIIIRNQCLCYIKVVTLVVEHTFAINLWEECRHFSFDFFIR